LLLIALSIIVSGVFIFPIIVLLMISPFISVKAYFVYLGIFIEQIIIIFFCFCSTVNWIHFLSKCFITKIHSQPFCFWDKLSIPFFLDWPQTHDPSTSTFYVAGITDVHHHIQPWIDFLKNIILLYFVSCNSFDLKFISFLLSHNICVFIGCSIINWCMYTMCND
jgi:hypothetical protein